MDAERARRSSVERDGHSRRIDSSKRSRSPYRHGHSHRRRRSPSPDGSSPRRRHRHHRRHRSRSRSHSRPRSPSPSRRHRHERDRNRERDLARTRPRTHSRSPPPRRRDSRSPPTCSKKPLPSQDLSYRGTGEGAVAEMPSKEMPNFKPTGLLAAETNKVTVGAGPNAASIVLKYHEPAEARKPPNRDGWVMYVFKGDAKEPLDTVALHERSCWLLGRELAVADVLIEHPSCSNQHAVLQFRHVTKKNEWGEKKDKVGLYLLDLESANGSFLNGERLDPARYVECRSGDVIKFGESTREYVILLPPRTST